MTRQFSVGRSVLVAATLLPLLLGLVHLHGTAVATSGTSLASDLGSPSCGACSLSQISVVVDHGHLVIAGPDNATESVCSRVESSTSLNSGRTQLTRGPPRNA